MECNENDDKHLTEQEYKSLCDLVDDHVKESFRAAFLKHSDVKICYQQFISVIFSVLSRHILRLCEKASERTGISSQVILIDVVRNLCADVGIEIRDIPMSPSSQTIN